MLLQNENPWMEVSGNQVSEQNTKKPFVAAVQ